MSTAIYLIIGMLLGGAITYVVLYALDKSKNIPRAEFDDLKERLIAANSDLSVERERVINLKLREDEFNTKAEEVVAVNEQLSIKKTQLSSLQQQFEESKVESNKHIDTINQLKIDLQNSERVSATHKANLEASNNVINGNVEDIRQYKIDLQKKTDEFNESNKTVSQLTAVNESLKEKIENQKDEVEALRKQFNLEFENIATKILDEKTKKFTDLNKDNLETLLKPLGDNLKSFKEKVEEVYDKESKERFSLGKEVEKLVHANQKISEEANNLTNALTSKSKTQGDWGQMILESILEKSGLVKDREYFIQTYLKDEHGNILVNEDGTKMQPDVIITYPDNRKVIVDSKVSLTAYNRYTSTSVKEEEQQAMKDHLKSLKKHIDDLSSKNYQDFAPSLDFVMMFVPIEPAYLMAIHADQDLWSYAYNKRILLTSPSNLFVALKMIVDLWKRDNQSKNHQEIVDRGGKLYDKFFMVLTSVKEIGANLKATQRSYNTAVSQLSEGNDNVLKQVEKLKALGSNAKKSLPGSEGIPLIDINLENVDLSNESE